jgi:imidazolonepropionase-like amidohydrolase
MEDGMDGTVIGPRLFVSGPALSPDGRARRLPAALGSAAARGLRLPAPGQHARGRRRGGSCASTVRELLQMGADQIKIMSSGGVASPTDPVNALGYSLEETRAIVDEAAARHTIRAGARVHARSDPPRGGVRRAQHRARQPDRRAHRRADGRARRGTPCPRSSPTRRWRATACGWGWVPESVAKVEQVRAAGLRSLALFKAAGVKLALGTDLLGGSHDLQSEELLIRAQVQSQRWTCCKAPRLIGAELLGQSRPSWARSCRARCADLLLVDGDPLADLTCLTGQGERIRAGDAGRSRCGCGELPTFSENKSALSPCWISQSRYQMKISKMCRRYFFWSNTT